jgi:transketolase
MSAATYNRKDTASVNALRLLSVDMVETAKSGHPGLPLGAAPLLYVLWSRFLKHDPQAPQWPDRDRFVLSPGHGSALLYSLLHLSGYGLTIEDLKNFRKPHSRTPGHPEYGLTPGVEATTGPLGQGFGMGVGLAMAERILAQRFNRPGFELFNHYTYALVSDGDLMEGVAAEAASLAGTHSLSKLIYIFDDNHMTIEGPTDLAFTEDIRGRFSAYGWQVIVVSDGEDLFALHQALVNAQADREKPSLIMCRTRLGAGSPKADTPGVHGEPLGAEALRATREFYGMESLEPFSYDPRVAENFKTRTQSHENTRLQWEELWEKYQKTYPSEASELKRRLSGSLPESLEELVRPGSPPEFAKDKPVATRAASGTILNSLAKDLPELIGGSADLGPSNKTSLSGEGSFLPLNPSGRNIHFGVREASMGAILNGLALHGAFIPFGGTFLVFSDYLRPAIRLSALMRQKVLYVLTHDSVGVGEDGPTHQPVEHILALRAIPNLLVLRPADAYETRALYYVALKRQGPSALILSRQNLGILSPQDYPEVLTGPQKGGYILKDANGPPDAIIIATGSEVGLALKALTLTPNPNKVRVVSLPSFELFFEQTPEYRETVLPAQVTRRLGIEAGRSLGWEKIIGPGGKMLSVEDFGFSGPAEAIFQELGFTPENVNKLLKDLLG